VAAEGLLSIGSFAMLTGLSVPALRHYHDAGILTPAHIDPQTGYRYFRPEQVRDGRLIRALRLIDLPLDDIAAVLGDLDPDHVRVILLRHRDRLSDQASLLSQHLAVLEEYIEKGVSVPTLQGNRIVMINIPVDNLTESRRFYEEMLQVEFAEERHEDGPPHLNATFGEWNTPSWFLLSLWPDEERAGTADIGFLVEDLDQAYERARNVGASSVHEPTFIEGMPRTALVTDPSGNHIGLYQG
jgi:DNA-binding transcriptional MerR regulator